MEKQEKVWTKPEIIKLIQTNDRVLYKALKTLYNEQSESEQEDSETIESNGSGFNKVDAEFMSGIVKFLDERGFLTDKQKEVTRKKLVKYAGQLTRLANHQPAYEPPQPRVPKEKPKKKQVVNKEVKCSNCLFNCRCAYVNTAGSTGCILTRQHMDGERDWVIEKHFPDLVKTESNKAPCPLCGGVPSVQKQEIYFGRSDHKWSCIRHYLRNIVCTKCGLQTRKLLYNTEYDDSDTVYSLGRYASDSEVWEDWDKITTTFRIAEAFESLLNKQERRTSDDCEHTD